MTSRAAEKPASQRVQVLDGLRGVAVILVFVTHAVAMPLRSRNPLDAVVRTCAHSGWTGVDLFFVLSGFLITGILLDTKGSRRWWLNFFMRRVLRVCPLYFGSLAFVIGVAPWIFHWTDPAISLLHANQAWYWTYTVNLLGALTHGQGTPPYGGHFWSLSIEEQFYLLWPLVVWFTSMRRLPVVCVCTMIGGLVFRSWLVALDPVGNANAAFLATPGRLDGLMVGASLAALSRLPGGLRRFEVPSKKVIWIAGILLAWLGLVRRGFEFAYADPVMAVVSYPVIALAWGALLVLALQASASSPMAHLLSDRFLVRCGKYSYGIYVFHLPLVGVALTHIRLFGPDAPTVFGSRTPIVLVLAAATALVSYAAAWLSYHLYERPFLDMKRYFVSARPERHEALAPGASTG
jgi:peptidoglycan/LPS O-acetylase OafA/YrhL